MLAGLMSSARRSASAPSTSVPNPQSSRRPALGLAGELRCGEHAGAVGDAAPVEAKHLHHAVAVEEVAVPEPEPLVHRGAVAVEGAAKRVRQPSLDAGRALERIGPNAPPAEQRGVRLVRTGEGLRPIGCSGPRKRQSCKGQRAEARGGDESPACPASQLHCRAP